MKLDPWYLEQWSAKADELYVNEENGRKARATKVAFDDATGREIFTLDGRHGEQRRGEDEQRRRPEPVRQPARDPQQGGRHDDRLVRRALGTISQVLRRVRAAASSSGSAPMPGPPGKGGVLVGGGALYIVKRSAPEKQAAAWEYLKFLDYPQTQADFAAGTGYVPIRKSSVDLPAIQKLWADHAGLQGRVRPAVSGVDDVATQGPVIGAYQAVRDSVLAGEQEMFTQGKAPAAALQSAANLSNAAMQEYNSRVVG